MQHAHDIGWRRVVKGVHTPQDFTPDAAEDLRAAGLNAAVTPAKTNAGTH